MGKYFENFEILYKYKVILLILSTFSFFMLTSQDLKQNENTLFLFGFLFPFIGGSERFISVSAWNCFGSALSLSSV